MNTNRHIYIFVIICLRSLKSEENFFVARYYNYDNYKCVTNSSAALSWIIEDTKETLQQVSTYIPNKESRSNYFDCDITEDQKTTNFYLKDPWQFVETVDPLILDRRWEDMDTELITFATTKYEKLHYKPLIELADKYFEVGLSIRTEKEAHIFLCDGPNPPKANCYWLMLQAWKGEASAIRKCGQGSIPSQNNKYPEGSCDVPLKRMNHSRSFPEYLSNEFWSHFMLLRSENYLSFTRIENYNKRLILDLVDNEISVTHIIIHTKMVNALWKIHKVDFIYTTQETNNIQIGPEIYPLTRNNELCVSMFVSMCQFCKLKLTLSAQNFKKEQQYSHQSSEWSEIKFLVENASYQSYRLSVSTVGTGDGRSWSWAIDKVRQCQKIEYRIISLHQKAKCQLMSSDNNVISPDGTFAVIESSCSEDTIGHFCVPCTWIYYSCNQIKVCYNNYIGDSICTCSAGYRRYDSEDYCYDYCNKGYYGHSCLKECGKCRYNCNPIDGTCSYCIENFSGPKCDIPPATIFLHAPNIVNVTYTIATVQIHNFELKNTNIDDVPVTYSFEISKDTGFNKSWTYTGITLNWFESKSAVVTNLKADTTYFIRAIISTKMTTYYSPYIPYAIFTTPCKDIAENDVDVKPQNTTVDIYIRSSGITCKVTKYVITTTPHAASQKIINDENHILFDNLLSFENYTVIFTKNQKRVLTETFQTTEGIPESVQLLTLTPTSPTTVALEWRQPYRVNGLFLHYIVEYKLIKYSVCNSLLITSQQINRLKVDGTSAILQDLIPFSRYTISVFAINTKFEGIPNLKNVTTKSSEDIATEEMPKISNIVTDMKSVTIELSSIPCTKIRGPLLGYVTATCTDNWCKNKTRSDHSDLLITKTISIWNLQPFSNYKLELIFCRRLDTCSGSIAIAHFRTKPAAPNAVQDILVYSKSNKSISLRWKPPYPPTGLLEEYKIEYKGDYTNRWTNVIFVKKSIGTTCKLWPEFSCVKILNLNKNLFYSVQISARNQNPENFGATSEVDWLKPGTDRSEAPYDLKFIWSAENDLELQWKHPNQSNGEIQYFKIEISELHKTISITKTLDVSEETYNLVYHYKIDVQDLKASTWYKATISAFNGMDGHPATATDTSPPEIPTLSTKPQFTTTNQTITIIIPPQKHHDTSTKVYFLTPTQNPEINKLLKVFQLENFKIVDKCSIGSNQNCQREIEYLDQGTSYNISIILENTFMNKTRYKFYSYTVTTMGVSLEMDNSSLFALFLLLLVIPLVTILFRKRHQLGEIKNYFLENYFSTNEMGEDQGNPVRLSTLSNQNKVQYDSEIEPLYANENALSKPIKIDEFQDYVKASVQNGELERQHALFPKGQTKPWTYGSLNENKAKNRYNNLIAYDHSRVILRKIKGEPNSDYINANYIDGHRIPKVYIATQGPKSSTLFDFWRMIWQENVAHIAMLANIYESGKKKVEKYWPEINETLKFGNILIAHVSTKVYADFEHRIFNVTRNGETRKVDQLHFLSWPDHGVPLYSQSLVPFLQKLLQIPIDPKSPIVVHCSAGVGRTGTILLCDICLRMAAKEGYLDILDNLRKIREQRANLVDNVEQYKLAHLVILECLFGKKTSIPCNEIEESVQKLFTNREISLQMEFLKETQWQDQAMKTTIQSNKKLFDHRKNRFPDIVPESQGQVFINPYKDETSSYINAVLVDGFRSPNRFIVTQQPMPNTLEDFWRLIDEKDVAVVISLNEINAKDKTSCLFWPSKSRPEMTPAPHLTLKHSNTLSLECYNLVTLQLNSKMVEIFSFKNWTSKSNCPRSLENFLTFWEDSDAASRKSKTVVVTCYDGVKASGLYVSMSFVIEKMKLEHCCDVCQAVRNVRHNRSQFVQEEEQFEFLYKAAVKYINGFQSYANFN